MSYRSIYWLILLLVLAVALAMPLYRHFFSPAALAKLSVNLKGGVELELQAAPSDKHTPTPEEMQRAMEVVLKRIDAEGYKAIPMSISGTDRIQVRVPGATDPAALSAVVSQLALLEFVNTMDLGCEPGLEFNQPGTTERKTEYVKYPTILTGADLLKADVSFNQSNQPIITFRFNASSADKFGEFTNTHVGQYLTILLDGKVLTSPVINAAIWGGNGVIEGHFTLEEANMIVNQLNAGTLPFPLTVISSKVVGPHAVGSKQVAILRRGMELDLQAVPSNKLAPTHEELRRTEEVLRKRIDPAGDTGGTVTQIGTDRIYLWVPGATDLQALSDLICQPALLEFLNTADMSFDAGLDFNQPGTTIHSAEYAKYETILTGADLMTSTMLLNSQNQPAIGFEFKPDAADKFAEFTANHVGQYLTVLFDGKVLTSPYINAEIKGGKGIIDGHFTTDEAQRIVNQLNAGALPVPLTLLSSKVIGPSSGGQ